MGLLHGLLVALMLVETFAAGSRARAGVAGWEELRKGA